MFQTLYSQAYCAKGLVYLQKAEEDTRLCKEHVTAFPVPLRTLNISDQVQEDIYTGIESFQKYAKLVEESADNQGCGVAYANLGRAYFLLEHYALASQYYEKVSSIYYICSLLLKFSDWKLPVDLGTNQQ